MTSARHSSRPEAFAVHLAEIREPAGAHCFEGVWICAFHVAGDDPILRAMSLPSHYKAEGQTRAGPCLICQTLTKGPVTPVYLGYGEYVNLCRGHASEEFRTKRNGRDFAVSIWQASRSDGRLTKNRRKALQRIFDSTNESMPPSPAEETSKPGSYAWPKTRKAVEAACKKGVVGIDKLMDVVRLQIGKTALNHVNAPSERTVRRWRHQRRWALPGWEPPAARSRG